VDRIDPADRRRAHIAVGAPELWAQRAGRAYDTMQRRFCAPDGRYRRDGRRPALSLPGSAAHLWPFIRAFVATLDLAGVRAAPALPAHGDAAIGRRLDALERYWDRRGPHPAYASDRPGTLRVGDRYYDDNAWVGLALVQLERMRPGTSRPDRAAAIVQFALAGWDRSGRRPHPGGVFWVEQGRGTGRRNHDRNTVSTAPIAQLALHLAQLGGASLPARLSPEPDEMYAWVNAALDAGRDGEQPGTGLYWDKLRGDGTVDRAQWSYNQGSMVGLNVLLARRGPGGPAYLARAEAIARRALAHYASAGYDSQPAAFNAIFFRNLLTLHAATADTALRADIRSAMAGCADRLWQQRRDDVDLLDHSALVSICSLLAWDERDYALLA